MTPGTPAWPGDPSETAETRKAGASSWALWLRAGASGSSKAPFGSSFFPPLQAGGLKDEDATHTRCDPSRGRAGLQVGALTWTGEDALSFA